MKNGINIRNIHSFLDLGFMIAKRNISIPEVNKITEKVPYQNGEYDFSKLNGELTYSNRKISYTFDIAEFDTKEMERQKRMLLSWATNVTNENIFDDYIDGYHFYGSYESSSWNEDFGQGELTINFSVYPYMIANEITEVTFEINGEKNIILNTESTHRIIPEITVIGDLLITKDNRTISIAEGTFKDVDFFLEKENEIQVTGTGIITFSYSNEVL